MWFVQAIAAGCAEIECSGPERAACLLERCGAHEGLERDGCLDTAITETSAVVEALALGRAVSDPVVRDASLILWIQAHRTEVTPAQGKAVCELLSDREELACLRRLSSAHLSR